MSLAKFAKLFFLTQTFWAISAQEVPKLLILKINNYPSQAHVSYLEDSLTDALREKLRQNYVFKEIDPEEFQEYTKANLYKKEDFYTETVSIKLGVELGQNVVISGRYYTVKEVKGNEVLHAHIKIFDMNQKKAIAYVEEKSPLTQDIFNAVDRIAEKVVKEAAQVLPDPITWKKMGYREKKEIVVFDRWELGFRTGAVFYQGGYTKYFLPQEPAFGLLLKVHFPLLLKNLFYQAELIYQQHRLKEGMGTFLEELNFSLRTTNYHFIAYIGHDFFIGKRFYMAFRAGGGFTYQSHLIMGSMTRTLQNSLPIFGGGADIGYDLTPHISLLLSPVAFLQQDGSQLNQIYLANLGINFKF